jgi:hypothetical protein
MMSPGPWAQYAQDKHFEIHLVIYSFINLLTDLVIHSSIQ